MQRDDPGIDPPGRRRRNLVMQCQHGMSEAEDLGVNTMAPEHVTLR